MEKDKITTLLLILVFLAGLSLLLYPAVSNYWNSYLQSKIIVNYDDSVSNLEDERYAELIAAAEDYNRRMASGEVGYPRNAEEYAQLLDPFDTGVMGYIEIPVINCKLPIAHGTDDSVLRDSVGHLEWTSLPVGGESTHSVLSGHRGLPSAELLTNIDRMEVGDAFYIHILDQVFEYRVDEINVIVPDDSSKLQIVEGKDYVTLLTCTPYGINSHRLLVRGERVADREDNTAAAPNLSDEVSPINTVYLLPVCLALLYVVFLIVYWTATRIGGVLRRKKHAAEQAEEEK
ncbi:MAG: class C sortase [Clostridia bacterium]|nr:class C sortase [Clostridia bacterium]